MQMPTTLHGLRFSDRQPVPFVSRFFRGLESRQALDSGGFRLEMTRMGLESHLRVADDIIPTSSSLGGFAMRTDGETLIQALRDDVRRLTLLKPNIDIDVESELLRRRDA